MSKNTKNTQAQEVALVRANRVSIIVGESGFTANFFRTHKLVGAVDSSTTEWVADAKANKTAQRESFRAWVTANSGKYGIDYDPTDRRSDSNKVPSTYDTDELALETATNMVKAEVEGWVDKMRDEFKDVDITLVTLAGDEIDGMTISPKGKPVDAKYSSGKWAWATVSVVAQLAFRRGNDKEDVWVVLPVQIVSGQMKKPTRIGELGYTFTGFKTEAVKDVPQFLPKKEVKAEADKEVASDK